jgi:predicted acyltransferase
MPDHSVLNQAIGKSMSESQRLLSLDFFRGLTIAAMILVNNPGSWSHVYPPLLHAQWHGWLTPSFCPGSARSMPHSLLHCVLFLSLIWQCTIYTKNRYLSKYNTLLN